MILFLSSQPFGSLPKELHQRHVVRLMGKDVNKFNAISSKNAGSCFKRICSKLSITIPHLANGCVDPKSFSSFGIQHLDDAGIRQLSFARVTDRDCDQVMSLVRDTQRLLIPLVKEI